MKSEVNALQTMLDNEQANINALVQDFVDLGSQIRNVNDQIREQSDIIQANKATLADLQQGIQEYEAVVNKLERQLAEFDKDGNLDTTTISRREQVKEVKHTFTFSRIKIIYHTYA
jgi:chromosome segregation ATPase